MEFTDNILKEKFVQTLCSTKLFNNEMDIVENLSLIDKWKSPMPTAILSGKLITRGSKTLAPRKFWQFYESFGPRSTFSFFSCEKVSAGRGQCDSGTHRSFDSTVWNQQLWRSESDDTQCARYLQEASHLRPWSAEQSQLPYSRNSRESTLDSSLLSQRTRSPLQHGKQKLKSQFVSSCQQFLFIFSDQISSKASKSSIPLKRN